MFKFIKKLFKRKQTIKKEKRCKCCRRIYLQKDRRICLKCESKLNDEFY